MNQAATGGVSAGRSGPVASDRKRVPTPGWGLAPRLAAATLVGLLGLSLLGSTVEFLNDWRGETDRIYEHSSILLQAHHDPALLAATTGDRQLAEKIVASLFQDESLDRATISNGQGQVMAMAVRNREATTVSRVAGLLFRRAVRHSTLLVVDTGGAPLVVGRLELARSPELAGREFLRRVLIGMASVTVRTIGTGAILVFILFLVVLRPLALLSRGVSAIDPSRPDTFRRLPPAVSKGDEIAFLHHSLAQVLAALAANFEAREKAEADLFGLARELEQRVRERTAELEHANREIGALNQRLAADNRRLGDEIEVSRRLQRLLLPGENELEEAAGSLDIAAVMEPATEVGGDYYDILHSGDRVRIGIGDVSGHGLESGVVALLMQMAVTTLQVSSRAQADAGQTLAAVNRAVRSILVRMRSDKTATLALIDYEPFPPGDGGAAGRLMVCGQHESLIILRRDGAVETIDTMMLGVLLGLVEDVAPYLDQRSIVLEHGDTLVLYSDGVTEAADEGGDLFGLERLISIARALHTMPPHDIRDAILAEVDRFRGTQPLLDDLTVIVARPR